MTQKKRNKWLAEFDFVQNEIKIIQHKLNKNPALLKDATFQERRTKLFYKSYCIDCTLHGEWAASYAVYAKGE